MIEISDLWIGQTLVDLKTNRLSNVKNLTSSSVEVYLEKLNDKGINCKQYFWIVDFNKRFRIATLDDLFTIHNRILTEKINKIFKNYIK